MMVTGMDGRNIMLALDLVDAKLLVAALRTLTVPQLKIASDSVMAAGFMTFVTDAQASCSSLAATLGRYTDQVVHFSREPVDVPDKEAAKEPCPHCKSDDVPGCWACNGTGLKQTDPNAPVKKEPVN